MDGHDGTGAAAEAEGNRVSNPATESPSVATQGEAIHELRTVLNVLPKAGAASSYSYDFPSTRSNPWILPEPFQVPKSVVRRAFRSIDQVESPDAPGEVSIAALLASVHRFHRAFSPRLYAENQSAIDRAVLASMGLTEEGDPDQRVGWSCNVVYEAFTARLSVLERLYFTLDMAENSTIVSKVVSITSFVTVLLSLACWVIGTVEEVCIPQPNCHSTEINACVPVGPLWAQMIETICVWIFTVEILCRLATVGHARRELLNQRVLISVIAGEFGAEECEAPSRTYLWRICWFLASPGAVCDILSVIPYWVEMWFDANKISALRVLYVVRVTRVFKLSRALNADLGRFNEIHDLFRKVVVQASPAIIMTGMLIVVALFFFGTFVWFCERGEWAPRGDPRLHSFPNDLAGAWLRKTTDSTAWELSPFESIPVTFWWTLVTISTVGYGDQVPYTVAGKVVGGFSMLYGTVILGLPLFVVGATFGQEYDRLIKASERRKAALQLRDRNAATGAFASRASQHVGPSRVFHEELFAFAICLRDTSPILGISADLSSDWLEGLKVGLINPSPGVALDRLSVRLLTRVAEAESVFTSGELDMQSVAVCRRLRLAWHKLSLSCFHLLTVPQEYVLNALLDCPTSLHHIGHAMQCSRHLSTGLEKARRRSTKGLRRRSTDSEPRRQGTGSEPPPSVAKRSTASEVPKLTGRMVSDPVGALTKSRTDILERLQRVSPREVHG